MTEFNKFPKVYHYGAALQDDDILVPDCNYFITEKMDGANAGIIRTEWGLTLHSRNRILARLNYIGEHEIDNGFRGFVEYVKERMNHPFFMYLEPGEHIFGEWLVPHTLKYPQEMYGHFYAFDPELAPFEDDNPIRRVPVLSPTFERPTQEVVEAVLANHVKNVGRPVEGVVISACEKGAVGEAITALPYRPRFKVVRPEFKEEAGKRWAVKSALAEGPVEDRLVVQYPVRAYKKVLERIRDHEDKVTKRNTPMVLGMTWHDYLTEFFPKALKAEKFPTVNTMKLKKEFESRVRDMFHTELDTGHLPTWAEHDLGRS